MLEDQYNATQDEYENIGLDVSGVTPVNDLEEYLQEALSFKLKYLMGNSFGGSDSTDIFDLAQLCLWEGGRAVNIGIELATVLDSFMFVTEVNCPSPSPFSESISNKPTNEGLYLSFSPNPTTELINFTSSNTISQVSISEMSGKVLYQNWPEESIFTLSPSLSPGMYLITSKDIVGNIDNKFIFIQ